MKKRLFALKHSVILAAGSVLWAGTGDAKAVFIPIDYPGTDNSYLSGISGNIIIGYYYDRYNRNIIHSFEYKNSTFSSIIYPSCI